MKKFITVISTLMAAALVTCAFTVSAAATPESVNRADIKSGDTVPVAHFNVNSGAYEMGTIRVSTISSGGGTYRVLRSNTYQASTSEVSEVLMNKLTMITEAVNDVFVMRKGKVTYSLYGDVDSESAPYSVAIAPYAVPMLEERGAGLGNNIWLSYGDKNGHVVDTFVTVAPEDLVVIPSVEVSVVTPKNMSIRLENGTVLSSGDTFRIPQGKTIRFQMCSNNWSNNIYDDEGNGIAGTVVYSVTVSDSYTGRNYDAETHTFTLPKGDKVLRTDVNSCFMAYRYYFQKGNYNKQTGIPHVVDAPLEALSVNLPLGSTVTSDAYKAFNKIDSANVFIEQGTDKALSYTDYLWNY